jgi:ATP dependent DNA ligase domain
MRAMEASDPHELARGLRVQEFGKTRPTAIDDALVEPAWQGLRVIASVGDGRATLWFDGEEVDEHPEVASALARAAGPSAPQGAILEAYLTKQAATEGIGVQTGVPEYPSASSSITRLFVGGRRERDLHYEEQHLTEAATQIFDQEDIVNLVVVDLLWLDGQWLLDVPLLERKRVLESIVPAEQLVRPGPYRREPIESWIGSWRVQGFRGLTFKSANSRYRPGETADDWVLTDMPRR